MWFHAKISYKVQDNLGKWKSFAEQFLLENITYGGAETDLATILEGRVTDYEYTITKIKFGAVYEPFNKGDFYKVTIEEKTTNEFDKEIINTLTHFVIADSVHEAEERTGVYIKSWVTDCTIIGAVRSKILGVWHPHNSMWQDDFKQRMLLLAEKGQESADANQLSIPFNKEDQLDDLPDASSGGDDYAATGNMLRKELEALGNSLGAAEVTVSGTDKNGKRKSATVKIGKKTEPVEAD